MSARTRPGRRAPALAVALSAAGVVLGLTACASNPPAPATPHVDLTSTPPAASAAPVATPPVEAGFDYVDPGEVCRRFVAALYSADTTRDAGPGDAYARAARYLTGPLAGQSAAAARDGRWATWSAHRARIEAQLSVHADVHQEPDTTITAERAYRLTATAVGVDGWRGGTEDSLVYCALTRAAGESRWRVSAFDVYPVPPR